MLQPTNSSGIQPLVFGGVYRKICPPPESRKETALGICICKALWMWQIFLNNSPKENPQKKTHRWIPSRKSPRLHHHFQVCLGAQKKRQAPKSHPSKFHKPLPASSYNTKIHRLHRDGNSPPPTLSSQSEGNPERTSPAIDDELTTMHEKAFF